MNKAIITGATGMIGVALINYLIENNIEVLAIIRENSKRKDNLILNPKLKIIECSLENLNTLEINENDYDVFFHLGWDGTLNTERYEINKQFININYTIDAVNLAKRCGCKKFIGVGSQAEFGNVDGIISEKTLELPNTAYGLAKLSACYTSRVICNNLGIEHIWTRFFSVYGPCDGRNTMIMRSIDAFLKGESIEYTAGEQEWEYLFSEDAANALKLLADNGKNNEIYCVGAGRSKQLKEYIIELKDIINKDIVLKLGTVPYKENQVMNLKLDISKLNRDTGFVPQTNFNEGIIKTINWYKKLLEKE